MRGTPSCRAVFAGSCGVTTGKNLPHSHPQPLNRLTLDSYKRPSWSTGFFVAIACMAAAMGGIMMWVEGKKVKKVEGVRPKVLERVADAEKGVLGHGHHAHKERFKEYVPPKEEKHGQVVEQPGSAATEVK